MGPLQEKSDFEVIVCDDKDKAPTRSLSSNHLEVADHRYMQNHPHKTAIIRPSTSNRYRSVIYGSRDSLNAVGVDENSTCSLHGRVTMSRERTAETRHVFLFDTHLLIAKRRYGNVFKLKTKIKVSDLWVTKDVNILEDSYNASTSLLVGWPPNVNYIVTFETDAQKYQWFDALSSLIERRQRLKGESMIKVEQSEETMTQIDGVERKYQQKAEERTQQNKYSYIKTLKVKHGEEATAIIRRCIPENEDAKNYQLVVRSVKDGRSFPLLGYEHPLSICLWIQGNFQSQARGGESSKGTDPLYKLELQRRKMHGDKLETQRQRTPLGVGAFLKRNQMRQNQAAVAASAALVPGRFFGKHLSNLCCGDTLEKPIMGLFKYLYEKGPYTVGIFRQSGSQKQMKELKNKLDTGDEYEMDDMQVHSVASTLKELLRHLTDCLLMCELYDQWIKIMLTKDTDVQTKNILTQVNQLPPANSLVLRHLLCVLCRIARHSSTNNMTPSNLAVCIAPSVLWPDSTVSPAKTLTQQHLVSQLIERFISHAGVIWPRSECVDLFDGGLPSPTDSIDSDNESNNSLDLLAQKPIYADNTLLVNDFDADSSRDVTSDLSPGSHDSGCAVGTSYIYTRSSSVEEDQPETTAEKKLMKLPDILEGQVRTIPGKKIGNVQERIRGMSKANSDDSAVCRSFEEHSYHSESELENGETDSRKTPNHAPRITDFIRANSHDSALNFPTPSELRLAEHPLGVMMSSPDVHIQHRQFDYSVQATQQLQRQSSTEQPSSRPIDDLFRVLETTTPQQSAGDSYRSPLLLPDKPHETGAASIVDVIQSVAHQLGNPRTEAMPQSRDIKGTSSRSLFDETDSARVQRNSSMKSDDKLKTALNNGAGVHETDVTKVSTKAKRTDSGKSDRKPMSLQPSSKDIAQPQNRSAFDETDSARVQRSSSMKSDDKFKMALNNGAGINETDVTKVSTKPKRTESGKSDRKPISLQPQSKDSVRLQNSRSAFDETDSTRVRRSSSMKSDDKLMTALNNGAGIHETDVMKASTKPKRTDSGKSDRKPAMSLQPLSKDSTRPQNKLVSASSMSRSADTLVAAAASKPLSSKPNGPDVTQLDNKPSLNKARRSNSSKSENKLMSEKPRRTDSSRSDHNILTGRLAAVYSRPHSTKSQAAADVPDTVVAVHADKPHSKTPCDPTHDTKGVKSDRNLLHIGRNGQNRSQDELHTGKHISRQTAASAESQSASNQSSKSRQAIQNPEIHSSEPTLGNSGQSKSKTHTGLAAKQPSQKGASNSMYLGESISKSSSHLPSEWGQPVPKQMPTQMEPKSKSQVESVLKQFGQPVSTSASDGHFSPVKNDSLVDTRHEYKGHGKHGENAAVNNASWFQNDRVFPHAQQRAQPSWGILNEVPVSAQRVTLNGVVANDPMGSGKIPCNEVYTKRANYAKSGGSRSCVTPDFNDIRMFAGTPQPPVVTVVTVTNNCDIISSRTQDADISCHNGQLPGKLPSVMLQDTDIARHRQLPHIPGSMKAANDMSASNNSSVANLRNVYEVNSPFASPYREPAYPVRQPVLQKPAVSQVKISSQFN